MEPPLPGSDEDAGVGDAGPRGVDTADARATAFDRAAPTVEMRRGADAESSQAAAESDAGSAQRTPAGAESDARSAQRTPDRDVRTVEMRSGADAESSQAPAESGARSERRSSDAGSDGLVTEDVPASTDRIAPTVSGRGGVETDAAAPRIARPAFAQGAIVGERYRLEQRLGAGGMGTVWRCRDEKLGVVVAIKLVGAGDDPARDERWRREVATARRIADRHVCRVHDLGEAAGVRYVTMELVEGTPLRALIGRLTFAQARGLFEQIVAGVAAIHGAGVVHRDLKPENVVVASPSSTTSQSGGSPVPTGVRAVIVDFGLARDDGITSVGGCFHLPAQLRRAEAAR